MRIERPEAFLLGITAAFLMPLAIPRVGIDFTYFFIMIIVLGAWFMLKWTTVKSLSTRGGFLEIVLGSSAIAVVYSYKIFTHTRLGILDMLIIFSALVVGFYGFKSVKLFWVPA